MIPFNERPVPIIDPQRCDGCRICVLACPTQALALQAGLAVVARPLACDYNGMCEAVCPTGAITRPFEIVPAEQEPSRPKPTKVVEKEGMPAYNAGIIDYSCKEK